MKFIKGLFFFCSIFFSVLILILMGGCVSAPPPIEEFTYARVAMESCRAIDAAKYSPGFFAKAESAFLEAQQLFDDRDYSSAKILFIKTKEYAEKAENSARLIRHNKGEIL